MDNENFTKYLELLNEKIDKQAKVAKSKVIESDKQNLQE